MKIKFCTNLHNQTKSYLERMLMYEKAKYEFDIGTEMKIWYGATNI